MIREFEVVRGQDVKYIANMKSLIVEQAANGFIVRDGFRSGLEFGHAVVSSEPHVFETFESLMAHLKEGFRSPEQKLADMVNRT